MKNTVENVLGKYNTDGYVILQLPIENDKTFRGYDDIHGNVVLQDYRIVYERNLKFGQLGRPVGEILESLFDKFNIDHPEDYRARSLSVSDVVALKKDNEIRYYFCDRFGWKKLA